MRRPLLIGLGLCALMLAVAGPVAAHTISVDSPGQGVTDHWVGGDTVPGQGKGMFGPFNLPAGHGKGLPKACMATMDNPSVVSFAAPPFFTGCHHGEP
ncbi:hypothetical protein BH23CHL7_BH23CHL7_19720 [soil metagenome]